MRAVLIILILLPLPCRALYRELSPEERYLRLENRGEFPEALSFLREWTAATNDPVIAEINLFRIRELSESDDLAEPALETLRALGDAPVFDDPFLRDRLELFTAVMHLRAGNLGAAESLISRAGFLDFIAAGPFRNGEEKNAGTYLSGDPSPGGVPWYHVDPDRTGAVRIDELMPRKLDSFCYFHRSVVTSGGEYYLVLGTTGPAYLWLDGTRIFTREASHGFDHDQYFIHVRLTRGTHRIMIRAGNRGGRIGVSLRLLEAAGGKPLDTADPGSGSPPGRCELLGITYFPALAALLKTRDPDAETRFRAGYLLHRARLGDGSSHPARALLASIGGDDFRRPAARRILAALSKNPSAKERHLREALAADPKSALTRYRLARLAASRGFVHDAWALAEGIVTAPHLRADAMIRIFRKNAWYPAALRAARVLGSSLRPARGLDQEAIMRIKGDDYHGAVIPLERFLGLDRFSPSRYRRLAACYEQIGSPDSEERLLARAVAFFPNRTGFRLRLAALAEFRSGPGAAVPHLASARKRAPYNGKVMEALGGVYERMDKTRLALHWYGRALEADPDSHDLRGHIARLGGGNDDMERLRFGGSLSSLASPAKPYLDEPAVTLLDETLISVTIGASSERRVRRVVMIATSHGAGTFPAPRITIDAERERVTESSLTLFREGVPVQLGRHAAGEIARDRLQVIEFDLPALVPGDILELEYRTQSRGNRDIPGGYSGRVAPGNTYRTMVFRAVLIHPVELPVYCHAEGTGALRHSMARNRSSAWHLIEGRNLVPPRREPMMPPLQRLVPRVYFTTFKTWDDFFSRSGPIFEEKLRLEDDITATPDSAGAPPMDRVISAFTGVSGRIRITEDAGGYLPSLPRGASETCLAGTGEAKDASLLLVALLRKAGIDARPALVLRNGPSTSLPKPGDFDHVLCYVNLGRGFFLDPSRGTLTLPEDLLGIPALVFEGSAWRAIPAVGASSPGASMESDLDITVAPSGDATMVLSLVDRAGVGPIQRERLRLPSRRIPHLNEVWNAAHPGASVTDVAVAGFDGNLPVKFTCTVSVPGLLPPGGGRVILDAFPLRSWHGRRYAPARSRIHPLLLPGPWTARTSVTFRIPPGYRVERLPDGSRFDHAMFSAEFTYEASGDTIRARSIVEVRRTEIPPGEYPRFRDFALFIDGKEREPILLGAPQR